MTLEDTALEDVCVQRQEFFRKLSECVDRDGDASVLIHGNLGPRKSGRDGAEYDCGIIVYKVTEGCTYNEDVIVYGPRDFRAQVDEHLDTLKRAFESSHYAVTHHESSRGHLLSIAVSDNLEQDTG